MERFDYAYSALGNLKSQQRGSITETYTYDARQRLTATTLSSGGGVSFAYSAAGNLQHKTDFSAGGNAYGYGGNGCGPHGASSVTMPLGNTVTYACDANGNVIGGSALTATFDAENRPRTIVRSASGSGGGGGSDLIFANGFQPGSAPAGMSSASDGSMSYAYDARGGRYAEIAAGRTTRYGPNGYEKVIAGTITHRHELGPIVIARVGGIDTVSYVLRDRLGSTVAISNSVAGLTERRQFDAFGKARNADFTPRPAGQANLTATNRGFTAHTQADDVWLVHMNGRVYDQNLGRFLSVDPVVQDGGSQALNPYSYIQNNPLSGSDPSGYASEKEECAGTNNGGCTVSPTTAATLTGSHIKGASSGANIEIAIVNPTAGGMAELAVAMAGMSSGYVVQTDVTEAKTTNILSADIGNVAARSDARQGSSSQSDAVGSAETDHNIDLGLADVPTEELKVLMRSDRAEDRIAAAEAAIEAFDIRGIAGFRLEYNPDLEPYGRIWPNLLVELGPRAYESWSELGSTLGHEIEVHLRQFVEFGNYKSNREFARREIEAHKYNLKQTNIDRYRNLAPEISRHQKLLKNYELMYENSR